MGERWRVMIRNILNYTLTTAFVAVMLAGCPAGDEVETPRPPEPPTVSEDILPSDNENICITS